MQNKILTTLELKQINKRKVYQYIYINKQASKHTIVNDLNMSISTVNQNLKELEDTNLILKNGFYASTGGRPSDILEINPIYKISIGVSILKDCIHIVALDLNSNILFKSKYIEQYINNDDYYKTFSQYIYSFIKTNNIIHNTILGVSIATQGIVLDNVVVYGTILNNNGMNIEMFKKHISFDCSLYHDSACATNLALFKHDITTGVVLLLNDNLGSGVIVDSNIISKNTQSGLIEHMDVGSGIQCYCGQIGCLETICSVNSLEKVTNRNINEFFDNKDTSIWTQYLLNLSKTIKNILMVLDGHIVLSGLLSSFITESDLEFIYNEITKSPFRFNKDRLYISNGGEYTQSIGAGLYYIQDFIQNI